MSIDNHPSLARLLPVGKFTLITLTALVAATALAACTRYSKDTTSDEIFHQHEEIPGSWQSDEDAVDTADEPSGVTSGVGGSGVASGVNNSSVASGRGDARIGGTASASAADGVDGSGVADGMGGSGVADGMGGSGVADGMGRAGVQSDDSQSTIDRPGVDSHTPAPAPAGDMGADPNQKTNDSADTPAAGGLEGAAPSQLPDEAKISLRADELFAWVFVLKNDEITRLVEQGLTRNFSLAQSWHRLKGLQALARIEGAGLYPQIGLTLGAQRGRSGGQSAVGSSQTASVGLQWEIDWLGRLSDQRRAAVLRYQSALQMHRLSQLRLAADIATGWYQLDGSERQLTTQNNSLNNLRENLEIIERGFRDGIKGGLDVLLARNDVARQAAVVRLQKETVRTTSRSLQMLLGLYPDGRLRSTEPAVGNSHIHDLTIPAGIPSDLLRRRPDLNAAWYEVLSADLDMAAASKDRFPRLSLTASYGGTSTTSVALGTMVNSGFNFWSIGASLMQNLFDGGRKRAAYRYRIAELNRIEQSWLHRVYEAFAQVETLLVQYDSLQDQLSYNQTALDSSEEAYALAFEQYTAGTIAYSTVLQAQIRAFEARSRWVISQTQLRRNRVEMFFVLGGSWDVADAPTDAHNGGTPTDQSLVQALGAEPE